MTYFQRGGAGRALAQNADLRKVREFLSVDGASLAQKANTLGGPAASARVFLLIEAINETCHLTRLQRRQLIALHKLLTLQDVGDPDRIETVCFSAIDPNSPFVIECCVLADRLSVLLSAISQRETPKVVAGDGSALHDAA